MHARRPSREELENEYRRRSSIPGTDSSLSSVPPPYSRTYEHHPGFSSPRTEAKAMALATHSPTGSSQQPTYRGHIKTTRDAILLLAACDLPEDAGAGRGGVPPPRRVTRRLLDAERHDLIRSGSIFVWDEKEAGMRRWTDGKCWSASRVSGCFLTYRELEARKKPSSSVTGGPTFNLYKADGLIKQSFSMTTTSGRKLHAISYYTKRDVREGLLRRVSEDPRFVGEGGGEWGLEVDDNEFPDPISRAGEMQQDSAGQESGSQSPLGTSRREGTESGSPEMRDRAEVADAVESRGPKPSAGKGSPRSMARESAWAEAMSTANGGYSEYQGYEHSKLDERSRGPALPNATPLHEARGLLPIQPIPVHSMLSDPSLRRSGRSFGAPISHTPSASPNQEQVANGAYFRAPRQQWPQPPASLKRPHPDSDVRDAHDAHESESRRPRLHRMRSSSMSGDDMSADKAHSQPLRSLARAGSDDGVSNMRSTHAWTGTPANGERREHDSAVGALLSLRSSTSGESCKSSSLLLNPIHSQLGPANANLQTDSMDSIPTKAAKTFSQSDRAALDRFSIKI